MKKCRSRVIAICWALILVGCLTLPVLGQVKLADAVRTADQDLLKVYPARNLDKSLAFFDEKGAIWHPMLLLLRVKKPSRS